MHREVQLRQHVHDAFHQARSSRSTSATPVIRSTRASRSSLTRADASSASPTSSDRRRTSSPSARPPRRLPVPPPSPKPRPRRRPSARPRPPRRPSVPKSSPRRPSATPPRPPKLKLRPLPLPRATPPRLLPPSRWRRPPRLLPRNRLPSSRSPFPSGTRRTPGARAPGVLFCLPAADVHGACGMAGRYRTRAASALESASAWAARSPSVRRTRTARGRSRRTSGSMRPPSRTGRRRMRRDRAGAAAIACP